MDMVVVTNGGDYAGYHLLEQENLIMMINDLLFH